MSEAYCPLCGVILQTLIGAQPPVNNLPWIAEIRAVKSVRGTSLPFVTGVGYLSPNHELIAHPDETTRYSDAIEGLETSPFHYTSGEYWVFPFHDACWSLLLSRTAKQEHDSAQVARHLFHILYCTPWNGYYTAVCGHDYGGASEFLHGHGNPGYSARLPPKWSFLTADPRERLHTDSQQNNILGKTIVPMSCFDQLNNTDVFCMLPNEAIVLILNDLTSADVCSLRQSSKRVAGISAFHKLPQSFWASRFEEEHEMGFALACQAPSELEEHTDWRRLYIAFKNSLQSLNGGQGIKNRRRIWHVLSNISKPLNDIMNNKLVQGKKIKDSHQHSGRYTSSPIVSAEVLPENRATDVLRIGSRRLVVDRLQWPQPDSPGQMKIGVSFTWFNGRSYVSGLRIWPPGYPHGSNESQQFGLIVPSIEKVVCFDSSLLDGFEVALTISGIIGLRFLIKGVSGQSAHTTGDFAMKTPDVGVAKLFRHRVSQISGIQMGFDICKLVSVQLIEQDHSNVNCRPVSPNVTPHLNNAHNTRDRPDIVGKIWSPETPMMADFIQSFPAKIKSQTFNLHLNMNFAGPGGRRLSSLQRIVALVDVPGLFRGLKFVYDDGESKRFCIERNMLDFYGDNVKCLESSFYIDGAAGERVSAVTVGCTTSLTGIKCIELYTNMGNHTFFGIEYEPFEPFPEDTVDYFSTLEPPSGAVITGFVATLGALDRSFKTFGIQSQACEDIKPPPMNYTTLPVSREFSIKRTPPAKAFTVMGTRYVQTAASLSNVRRVRVSVGGNGFSRLPEHISGLWLEYYNTDRPSIVGQWLNESGAFDLALGEQLIRISIWTSNEHAAAYSGNAKLGKVIALRFDTSGGQSLRFGQGYTGSAVHLKFIANTFEKLDTLCWASITKWDHATVIHSPQPNQAHHALHLAGRHIQPWIVPEKVFWTIVDTNSNPSSVASIHVSLIPDAIASLSFTYTSGNTYTLGSMEGETSTLRLENGEELVRLDTTLAMVNSINSVVSVSIHTNYKRIVAFRSQTYFEAGNMASLAFPSFPSTSSIPPPPSIAPMVQSSDPDYIFSLHPTSDISQAAYSYEIFEFPTDAETFVGFWGVVGRRERRLQDLGPIFTVAKKE